MTEGYAVRTVIEIAVALLLIYGFAHEKKVIAFENKLIRAIIKTRTTDDRTDF